MLRTAYQLPARPLRGQGPLGNGFFAAAVPQDNRMMEAAGVINRLFASDPAARRRNLYLRCVVVMV